VQIDPFELEKVYLNKELHPQDLKATVAKYINQLLEPVRKHFKEDNEAKRLLEQVKSFQITR
jgi:tyrosyl-tRNA synthetase